MKCLRCSDSPDIEAGSCRLCGGPLCRACVEYFDSSCGQEARAMVEALRAALSPSPLPALERIMAEIPKVPYPAPDLWGMGE